MQEPLIKNGKTILSSIDPVRRAERLAESISVKSKTLYFCPSPLFGYGLARLLERLKSETSGSAILCTEADAELYFLSVQNIPQSVLNDNLFLLTDKFSPEYLFTVMREKWGVRSFRRIEVVRFTGGWQLFSQLYDSLCDALRRQIVTEWSNVMTLAKLGRLYIRNALRNLSLISSFPSIDKLSFGSSPILVLGAGPSLDETLEFLPINRTAELPYKIVCVDTCLGALEKRDIKPDLVVILESQHWNIRDFTGCRNQNIPFAIDLSALPASAKMLSGQGYLFFTQWTKLNIFERLKNDGLLPKEIPPLGSVGLASVEIARHLTSGKIICAGLDFSFSADKYHARDTPGHRNSMNNHTRFGGLLNNTAFAASAFQAVSKTGVKVFSNPIMQNYRDLAESEFSSDPRLFSFMDTGLPLGIKTLPLDDIFLILTQKQDITAPPSSLVSPPALISSEKIRTFIKKENNRLLELRAILKGDLKTEEGMLEKLIAECDYLWAHFPDYAGGVIPDLSNSSFLRRVRTEIDFTIALLYYR